MIGTSDRWTPPRNTQIIGRIPRHLGGRSPLPDPERGWGVGCAGVDVCTLGLAVEPLGETAMFTGVRESDGKPPTGTTPSASC